MSIAVPWLLGAKVAVPARVDAYFNRSQTFEWSEAAGSGIVVMQAPGGFGKTTLLGEIYRRERERGVLAAWLTLDEDDTAEGVGAYLAYAFERAGLDTPAVSDAFEHSMGLVARSIEAHALPACWRVCRHDRSRRHGYGSLGWHRAAGADRANVAEGRAWRGFGASRVQRGGHRVRRVGSRFRADADYQFYRGERAGRVRARPRVRAIGGAAKFQGRGRGASAHGELPEQCAHAVAYAVHR